MKEVADSDSIDEGCEGIDDVVSDGEGGDDGRWWWLWQRMAKLLTGSSRVLTTNLTGATGSSDQPYQEDGVL